ncbi:NAD(P)H-hydrate epimerase [Ilumatobacter sp.]|jgi:NAD(P)H-hydrate epimerase|nr:NAD(P)H-hydrate epimerase [Ilumatobacter sp.]MBT7430908.1 NAD(P)H-hydrate epimerase [Ilumatobacter sp.]MDG1393052.1 NAD(P)H-hydrate epimerase [Ilumatobacter sp.]MDG1785797.1 NAD(P)H-hydrate epimerase [Ilumatobacter sp.]
MHPIIDPGDVAWITETDMIEVDRTMIEDLRIELLQMMENAGRNLARLVLDLAAPMRVAVAAGSGGNGGGGLVAARHLANAGVDVTVTTTRPGDELSPVPAHQFDILRRMGIPTEPKLGEADVIIDSLIGYSLRGAPSGRSAALIDAINDHPAMVVSLDAPSGLDVTTGATPGAVVRAGATLTLALPKVGMRDADVVGALYLADISVPRSVAAAYGSPAPDFRRGSILRII